MVISGFHSLLEQEYLVVLLRGPGSVIVCLAHGLARMCLKLEYKNQWRLGGCCLRRNMETMSICWP